MQDWLPFAYAEEKSFEVPVAVNILVTEKGLDQGFHLLLKIYIEIKKLNITLIVTVIEIDIVFLGKNNSKTEGCEFESQLEQKFIY